MLSYSLLVYLQVTKMYNDLKPATRKASVDQLSQVSRAK